MNEKDALCKGCFMQRMPYAKDALRKGCLMKR